MTRKKRRRGRKSKCGNKFLRVIKIILLSVIAVIALFYLWLFIKARI